MEGIGFSQLDSAKISSSQVAREKRHLPWASAEVGSLRLAVYAYSQGLQGLDLSNGQHVSHNHASNNCHDSIDHMTNNKEKY